MAIKLVIFSLLVAAVVEGWYLITLSDKIDEMKKALIELKEPKVVGKINKIENKHEGIVVHGTITEPFYFSAGKGFRFKEGKDDQT